MIDRLLAVLAEAQVEADPRELRDALWLAGHLAVDAPATAAPIDEPAPEPEPESPDAPEEAAEEAAEDEPQAPLHAAGENGGSRTQGGNGLPAMHARSPAVPALRHRLRLARSLRPLKRRVPSKSVLMVDEDATVARAAEEGIWLPVLRPIPDRWLDLVLAVDASPSMIVWRRTVTELRALFEQLGAFRTVRILTIDASAPAQAPVTLGPQQSLGKRAGAGISPAAVVDPTGRTAVVVVTDGVGAAWHDGRMGHILRQWGCATPTGVVTVLPQRMWAGSALRAVPARVRTPRPGAANGAMTSRTSTGRDPVPIPVMELSARWLGGWARLVAGAPGWHAAALLAPPPTASGIAPEPRPPDTTAAAITRRFRDAASPTAFQLACYLSAAWLNLPVMRMVQRTMLPASDTSHLAEVFLGGLLTAAPAAGDAADPETTPYDFLPGVRDELNSYLLRDDLLTVLRETSRFVSERFGQPFDFPALLADPEGAPLPALGSAGAPPMAYVAAAVLAKLGGRYKDLADRLPPPSAVQAPGSIRRAGRRTDGDRPAPTTVQPQPTQETSAATGLGPVEPRRMLLSLDLPHSQDTLQGRETFEGAHPHLAQTFISRLDYDETTLSAPNRTRPQLLEELATFLGTNSPPEETLLAVHIAGRAAVTPAGVHVLLTADTDPAHLETTGLPVQDLVRALLEDGGRRRVLLVLDIAQSQESGKPLTATVLANIAARWTSGTGPGLAVLCSVTRTRPPVDRSFPALFDRAIAATPAGTACSLAGLVERMNAIAGAPDAPRVSWAMTGMPIEPPFLPNAADRPPVDTDDLPTQHADLDAPVQDSDESGAPLGRPISELLPFALGVHPAYEVGPVAGAPLPVLPRYVNRDHDQALREVVHRASQGQTQLAVLIGEAVTGKTRACWEAVRTLPLPWRLWQPSVPDRPGAFARGLDAVAPHTVIWLDDLDKYLLTHDQTGEDFAATLEDFLRTSARTPLLVLGTMRVDQWRARTPDQPSRHSVRHERASLMLQDSAILVPSRFTSEDLRALSNLDDPTLASAAQHAQRGEITQTLAGGLPLPADSSSPMAEPVAEPARLIQNRYRLLDLIGRGGMGEVWRARDESLGRHVAVKCLKPLGPRRDESVRVRRERFRRQARVAAVLQHRGVTAVHDFGESDGILYLVMELLDGRNLSQLLRDNKRHPLPVADVVDIADQVADTLAYTHQQGIVHGELKPANIIRLTDGTVKICDFGIARLGQDIGFSSQLTGTGIAMGTPHYMSPEQIGGDEVAQRSDLYSLGCVLYEIATGAPPFDLDDAWAILVGHRDTPPEPPRSRRAELPEYLEKIILDLLAKRPEQRPQTAAELAERIRAGQHGRTSITLRATVSSGEGSTAAAGHISTGQNPRSDRTDPAPPQADKAAGSRQRRTRPAPSPEQLAALAGRHNAGLSLGRLDRWQEAGEVHRAVAAERASLLGPDHPDTLASRYEIGFSLSRTERAAEALDEYTEVAQTRERVLGADHPDTLAARQEMAFVLGQLGRHFDAHQVYVSVLDARERGQGPDHPDTLRCRHNLAFNLSRLGRLEDSHRMAGEVAAARARVLGPDHPDTLVTRYEVAYALGQLGRWPEALHTYREVADARAQALGPEHADTLAARYEVGISLGRLGRSAEALTLYRELIEVRTRVQGPTHPETLRARHGLGVNLGRLGRWEEALAESRDVCAIRERVLGPDHPDTLVSRREVAVGLGWLGRWDEALVQFRQMAEARERVLGPDHPDTLASRNDEAHCLEQLGRSAEAVELYRKVAVLRQKSTQQQP